MGAIDGICVLFHVMLRFGSVHWESANYNLYWYKRFFTPLVMILRAHSLYRRKLLCLLPYAPLKKQQEHLQTNWC